MTLVRTLRTALRALRRNVTRSALTILGIVIGIGAVIIMMEIGKGSQGRLIEFEDNVFDMRYLGIGPLALENLGLRV